MNAYLLNCFPHIIDQRTNCCDVSMTESVCCTIIIIAIIAAITLLLWHRINIKAGRKKEEMNNNNDSNEKSKKAEDKRNYISKLIAFRDELSKKDSKYKGHDDPACVEYINLLTRLSEIDKDNPTKK